MPMRTLGGLALAITLQAAALALYKELVETNTTLSSGSCTLLAERIAAYLKAAGYVGKDTASTSAGAYVPCSWEGTFSTT